MIRQRLIAWALAFGCASPAFASGGADPLAVARDLQRQHRFQAAEKTLATILERAPDDLGANLQMGHLLHYLGDDQGSLRVLKRAAVAHPRDLEAQAMLVHAYLWVDRLDEAERQAERTSAAWEGKRPDGASWAKLLVGLGGVQGLRAKRDGLWAMIKYGLAVRLTFEKAYATDPEGVMPLYALGRYYLEAPAVAGGDPAKGFALLRRAIGRDPENHVARAAHVQYLDENGQQAAAREELAAFLKDFDDVPAAMATIQPLASRLK